MPYYHTESGWEYTYDPADPLNPFGVPSNPFDQWSAYVTPSGALQLPEDPTPGAGRGETPRGMEYTRGFEPSTGQYVTRYQWPSRNVFGMSDLGVAGLLGSLFLGGGAGLGLATAPAAAAAAGAAGAAAPAAAATTAAAAAPSLLGVPLSTLSTVGTIGSLGGMGAQVLGGVTGQPWLSTLGKALGITGGLAGGLGGLANVASTGVTNLAQAARLASSLGRVGGAIGGAAGNQTLGDISRYLGLAGSLGNLANTGYNWLTAPGSAAAQAATPAVQAATQVAQQGGRMGYDGWGSTNWLDWGGEQPWQEGYGVLASGAAPSLDWGSFTAGGPGSWFGQELTDYWNGGAGGGLGAAALPAAAQAAARLAQWQGGGGGGAGGAGSALGGLASWLGPAISALGSLGGGLIGSNAAADAAAAQAAALNRGIDLQTAQWLQQQQNLAPWLEAGRGALGQLQGLAGQGQPTLPWLAPMTAANYAAALPGVTPGWTPITAGPYTPGETPSAAAYRYTPGTVPGAAQYRYTPGAVPTLSGQELLANDPGVQFRLEQGRQALEASAAARGGLLSGPTMAALQRQGQELSSQEYANAWQRASQQAQLRENWAQAASQLGFGQAMDETRLREQLAQGAGAQNWQQALQEAQQRAGEQYRGWQSGLTAAGMNQQQQQAWQQELYNRQLQQAGLRREWDTAENQEGWNRLLQQYNAQMGAGTTGWNRWASLAGLGQTATGQLGTQGQAATSGLTSLLGQLGQAQAGGQLGTGQAWLSTLGGLGNTATNWANNQQFLNLIGSLNR